MVQSALGEPLKAEIEVPDISPDEAASLKANIASPSAFVAAGFDYNAAMSGLRTTLARRSDGRLLIRVTGDRAINEPFVDMILEVSSSSTRIVRDYTMLFDPPSLKQPAPLPMRALSPPVVASIPMPVKTAPLNPLPVPVAVEIPRTTQVRPAPLPPADSPAIPSKKFANGDEGAKSTQVTAQPGDSASKIAMRVKSGDVSLDQMLVALLHTNPDSFPMGNLNNLRVGTVLDVPSSEQAKSVSKTQAAQIVVAQSKDFNEFRRTLGSSAPKADVEAPNRKISGKVEAVVEVMKPVSSPDRLTLSNGSVKSSQDVEKLAREIAQKDVEKRTAELEKTIAELSKTISEMKKLSIGSAPKTTPTPEVLESKPALPTLSIEVIKAAPPQVVASAPEQSLALAAPKVPSQGKPNSIPVLPANAVKNVGLVEQLKDSPVLPASAGLLLILGALALYRKNKTKKRELIDSEYVESQLVQDTYIGVSGGQRIDTHETDDPVVSSLDFSHGQMNVADGIDPVAEAEVYIAYGRDAQAEEILREAILIEPKRLAIHMKLLDMYVKRSDSGRFETIAQKVLDVAGVGSHEWKRVCNQGLDIDPKNPLYQPVDVTGSSGIDDPIFSEGNEPLPQIEQTQNGDSKFDMDLDFSYAELSPTPLPTISVEPYAGGNADSQAGMVDFDISEPAELQASEQSVQIDEAPLDFSLDLEPEPTPVLISPEVDFSSISEPVQAKEEIAQVASEDSMLDFDLGFLGLDAEPDTQNSAAGPVVEDPLETKMELAKEFISIGDLDGARALIGELMEQSTGELRENAERALAEIN